MASLRQWLALRSRMLPRRRSSIAEAELRKECEVLQLKLLRVNSALRLKTLYAERLEHLVHERSETIDQLTAKLDQSRQQVQHLSLQNEILVAMIAAPQPEAMLVPK